MRRFLAIEGPIGVGKTTLCRRLSEQRGAELILEPHEDNPFLAPFYKNPSRYGLALQLHFLLTRFHQQDRVRQLSLFHDWVVADYVFAKDRMFAEKTLSAEEMTVYDRVAGRLGAHVPTPDLVVVLDAPVDVLLERIGQRAIAGEEEIDERYLTDLLRRYDTLWARWNASPVLRVDTTKVDTRSDAGIDTVLAMVDAALKGPGGQAQRGSNRAPWPELF